MGLDNDAFTAEPTRSTCPEINPSTPASVEVRLIICPADDGDLVVLHRFTLLLCQFLVRMPQRWEYQLLCEAVLSIAQSPEQIQVSALQVAHRSTENVL